MSFSNVGKAIDSIVTGFGYLSGLILLTASAITGYEIVSRYVFGVPTHWALELSIYLLIWYCFASAPYVLMRGGHVRVDLVISRFPPRTRAIWEIVSNVIFLVFALLLLYFGGLLAAKSISVWEISFEMWEIIMWPVKLVVPICGILLVAWLLKDTIVKVRFLDPSLEKGTGILAKPAILVLAFLVLIAGTLFLYTVNAVVAFGVLVVILLFGGVPIFPALALVGVAGYYLVFGGLSGIEASFARVAFSSLYSFALVCLPLFILVGQILRSGGVGEEIYDFATKWIGHFPAGEGIVTIVACSIFAAISTSSVATAVTIGLIALPALAARKYDKKISYGLLAAGGTLGIMIPPSGTMIIYSAVTEESVGKLFMAGIFPGIILAALFILYSVVFFSRRGGYERAKPATWSERLGSTRTGVWGLLAPVIILGGIYSGIFTPLEAGAVAVLYSLTMVVARRKVKLTEVPKVLTEGTISATMVLAIIVGALVMGNYMCMLRVPDMAMEFVIGLGVSPWTVMAAIMLLYLILGMFLEVVSCMMITLPIIYPLIISLGFDGIWFAVMVTLNMEMALITPPVGLNLYVITGITKASLADVLRGVLPFFLIMVAGLALFALVPSLSTWLPSVMVTR